MNLRRDWWKISGLIIIAVLINAVGHFIDGTRLWTDIDPLSIFSKAIGIEAVATIFFIVFFFSMSVTFLLIERWLNGSKIIKGLKFGISWGVIFFLGGIETYPVFGKSSLFSDMRLCFVDLISVVAFGALLGQFLASDDPRAPRVKTQTTNSRDFWNDCLILLVTTSLFLGGRYFAYSVLKIESGFIERPVSTFLWTLATGLSFGALYILTGRNLIETSLIKRSAFFGLLNVGTNWLVFNLFWPFVYRSSVWRFAEFIVGRALVDTAFVIFGVYASERLISMKEKKA